MISTNSECPADCTSFILMLTVLFCFFAEGTAWAQMQKTLLPSQDNTLYESTTGSLSNGAGNHLFVGRTGPGGSGAIRRGLLRFAVADSIPAMAKIDSVVLAIYMSRTIAGTAQITLHRIERSWGEGESNATGEEGVGGQSMGGDATWIHSFFDTTQWSQPGGDFSAEASDAQLVMGEQFYFWGSTERMVEDVQDWLDSPVNNHGWLVKGDETTQTTTKRFDTREHPTHVNRPRLMIYYSLTTYVQRETSVPHRGYRLEQNHPNPFNPSTQISFTLPVRKYVRISVFNSSGQEIRRLASRPFEEGQHVVIWNGRDNHGRSVASGIYLYTIRTSQFVQSKKMLKLN